MRKKAGLEPTDVVEVYIKPSEQDASVLQQVLNSQVRFVGSILHCDSVSGLGGVMCMDLNCTSSNFNSVEFG